MAPSTRTYVAKPTDRERNWLVVDANGKTLGRMATQIADALRGKRKPQADGSSFLARTQGAKCALHTSDRGRRQGRRD